MSRRDLVAMFDGLGGAAQLHFVEYAAEWGEGMSTELYAGYGALRTWEASGSANRLLDDVSPDLVAFVSCTSYNQVALRCAARARGLRCVHLEHGLRRPPSSPIPLGAAAPTARGGPRLSSWRTHAFFARSVVQDRHAARPLLAYAADIALRGSSDATLRRHADLRRLDHYISFSAECFDYHRHVDRLAGVEPGVTFVGVPQFDVYAAEGGRQVDENAAILVDHQLANEGVLGWNLEFRERWAADLSSTLADAGITLYVKEHPGDRTRTWRRLGASNVRVVEESELPELARDARTVLGLASTLQMPLAALAHVAHIALELHPMPGGAAAQAFVAAGVAEPVRSFAELAAALERRREVAATQRRSKAAFERRFLFALDGQSGERFRAALLSQARQASTSYDRAMPTPPTAVASRIDLVARRLLDSHPRLRGNRLVHEIQRRRAYRQIELRPELTSRPDLVRELDERGVAIVPDYVDRATVARMLAAAEDQLERARRGELDDTFTVQPSVVVRIARADRRIPETRPFFQDSVIRSVMQAYMSPDVASYRRELEYRFGLAQAAQADLYHFDNWRPICKAFLYLVDVTEANAPFVYVAGSHKRAPWRVEHEIAYDARGAHGRFGHLFPQEMRELRERHGWEDLVCTGSAGTLILADFRGLHRGTPLEHGRRVLLNNTFDLMNPEAV